MPFNAKSLISLRSWLFYAEVVAVIGFMWACFFLYSTGYSGIRIPTPVTGRVLFIQQADVLFRNRTLPMLPSTIGRRYERWKRRIKSRISPINGILTDSAEVRLRANLRIAEIYSQSNWLKDAKARLEYAERIQPEHAGVRLLRGKLFRDEGLLAEATEEFLAVLKNAPNHAEAHYLLGVLYQGSKQFEQAAEHYTKAVENDPEFLDLPSEKAPIGILARLQLSRTYARMLQGYQFLDREFTETDLAEVKRLESESILLLEQAHENMPEMNEVVDDLVRLLFVRASALEREDIETRQYVDALQVYERIVELDPEEVRAWERMGEIYASFLGDKEAALGSVPQGV